MIMMALDDNYLEKLRERGKKGHIYREFQDTGLMLADILGDRKHKALYIKLAKERDKQELLTLAKRVAENKNVKNKGAYFMRILFDEIKGKKR
jgi:hypothetical protein